MVDLDNAEIPESMLSLMRMYMDYAAEVVLERAIPAIDGWKPGQRRILFKMFQGKVKSNVKCMSVVGDTIKIHPHGDSSIYSTLVRMVDSNETMNIPFISGQGAFSKVFTNEKPAGARYTECRLAPVADELFAQMAGVEYQVAEDTKTSEPLLLPVTFPNILCNASQGVAVGISSNIPSFNFHEVNEAVLEYLETGEITKTLIPDFSTGGYIVDTPMGFEDLNKTGRGSIKLRGEWYIDGKMIVIEKIPYYTTVGDLMRQIKNSQIEGISSVRNETDRNGLRLTVTCSNRNIVPRVLNSLLDVTDLQKVVGNNIVVVIDGEPRLLGVRDLIKSWCAFRARVLDKQFKLDLEDLNARVRRQEVFVTLLEKEENVAKFINLVRGSEGSARQFIREICNTGAEDEHILDWILNVSLKSLNYVKNRGSLDNLLKARQELEFKLNNINKVIASEIRSLNSKYKFPRRTEVTDIDYVFDRKTEVVREPVTGVYVFIDGKFIKKIRATRYNTEIAEDPDVLQCNSDNVIAFLDDTGRILRVHLEQIEYSNSKNDLGTYLPTYFGIEDDFEIVVYNLVESEVKGYIYSDGFASVVDYSEWVNNRRVVKIIENGTNEYAGLIFDELDLSKDWLVLISKQGRVGVFSMNFKRKARTARTRLAVLPRNDEVVRALQLTDAELILSFVGVKRYMYTMKKLAAGDSLKI